MRGGCVYYSNRSRFRRNCARTVHCSLFILPILLLRTESQLYRANDRLDGGIENVQLLVAKLNRLLTWSVRPLRFGDHRPFVAAMILRRARAQWGARAARRNSGAPDGKLQDSDLLFEWLDWDGTSSEVAAVALLFGELVRTSFPHTRRTSSD